MIGGEEYPKVRIQIDQREHIYADGVMIGRRVRDPEGHCCIEICDKDRRRSSSRGTRFVYIPVEEFENLDRLTPTIESETADSNPARRAFFGESPDPEGSPYCEYEDL